LKIQDNQIFNPSNPTLFPKLRKVYRRIIHLDASKRKNEGETPPNKKQKTKKKPEFVTVPLKELFSKDSPGKGRPALSDEVIDILADLQTKNHTSANQAGEILLMCGDFWMSQSEHLPSEALSKQSALRSLLTKGIGADFEIAKILSKAPEIWIGVDGASEDDRHFIELHAMGAVEGEYFTHFLNLMEKEHFTGKEIASWISEQFEYYSKLQRQLKIRETPVYAITGVVFDTTSENTGKYNGVAACLDELRQSVHEAHFKRKCTPLQVKSKENHPQDQILL
jgi:hypothetical protein